MQFECRKCNATWGGYNTCHCHACGEVFTGLSAFDKHRTGPHSDRSCLHPATAVNENPDSDDFGEKLFKRSGRDYPCWSLAGDMPEFWSKA
ncbi:hypothetical protein SEA_SQUINT_138 [Mycobacterium phage Squint]|nr:hypothetical protein SEA_SQUINT_138 [Mycobacterium phage Squint]